jgi:hypothetical protein
MSIKLATDPVSSIKIHIDNPGSQILTHTFLLPKKLSAHLKLDKSTVSLAKINLQTTKGTATMDETIFQCAVEIITVQERRWNEQCLLLPLTSSNGGTGMMRMKIAS